jgi:hypothetical protein
MEYRITPAASVRFEELTVEFRKTLREAAVRMADASNGACVTPDILRRAAISACNDLIAEWSANSVEANSPRREANVAGIPPLARYGRRTRIGRILRRTA